MWLKFLRDWTWIPAEQRRRPETAFKAGMRLRVTRACAAAALEAGAAEESSDPRFDGQENADNAGAVSGEGEA